MFISYSPVHSVRLAVDFGFGAKRRKYGTKSRFRLVKYMEIVSSVSLHMQLELTDLISVMTLLHNSPSGIIRYKFAGGKRDSICFAVFSCG